MFFRDVPTNKVMFVDLETVPEYESYLKLPPQMGKSFEKKAQKKDQDPVEMYEQAGLFPEWGKIVCVSYGYLHQNRLIVDSYYGSDEKDVVGEFTKGVLSSLSQYGMKLCAHNGQGFDFPFLAKRIMKHGMAIPSLLNNYGKKPWEMTELIDTQEVWRMTSFSRSSMDELTSFFGIPTPKDDMDGSKVKGEYEDGNIEGIRDYCEKDVEALYRVFCAMKMEDPVETKRKKDG